MSFLSDPSDNYDDPRRFGAVLDRSPANLAKAAEVVRQPKPRKAIPTRKRQPWQPKRTTPTIYTKRLLLAAARWADSDGVVERSERQLAGDREGKGAGIGLGTVSRHLRIAEANALIEVLHRPDPKSPDGPHDTMRFRITAAGWTFMQVRAPFPAECESGTPALVVRCSPFAQHRGAGLDNPCHDRWFRRPAAHAVWVALKDGPATARDVIQRTGLARRTVYDQLKWLAGQGLCAKDGHLYERVAADEDDSFEIQKRRIRLFEAQRRSHTRWLIEQRVVVLVDTSTGEVLSA